MSTSITKFKNLRPVAAVRSACRAVRGLFPVTWGGLLMLALAYWVWYREVSAHANQILYTAVLLWVCVFAVLLGFTLISSLVVYLATRGANSRVHFEEKTETGGHVHSPWRVYVPFYLPLVQVETSLEDASVRRHEVREFAWAREWLEPVERGRLQTLRRRITVSDIFGLTSISFVMTQHLNLEIVPVSGHFETVSFKTRTTGEGYSHPEGDPRGELVEMRRYQAGDPLRLVLWKVFARSRKLVVRAPEPAIVEENDMFVYFVSGNDDENSASMAKSFLEAFSGSNFAGEKRDMYFAADGAKRIAASKSEGLEDVIDSVGHRVRGGEDLMQVAQLVSPSAMSHCFLLVPSTPGSWVAQIRAFVEHFTIRPVFIVSVDGENPLKSVPERGVLRRLFCRSEQVEDKAAAFHSLCCELGRLGTVRIVDVKTGATSDFTGDAP